MDAITRPIERIVEASEHFMRTPSRRVLHVVTSSLLRIPALQHLCATELLEQNTEPYFVLESPTEPGDDGWLGRTRELRADWEALLAEAPSGAMAPLWPEARASAPVARFGLELGLALGQLRAPMTGLVIVLAPLALTDADAWRRDLGILLRERGLAKARFVLVETEEATSSPILDTLAQETIERVDARIDVSALQGEMRDRVDRMANAPPGASGPILTGAAGPSVTAPRRVNEPPTLSPAERAAHAEALGIPAAYLDLDAMQRLRVLVMSAALAFGRGEAAEAVRLQREARDHCLANAMTREAVVNELVLAGYVLQGGSHERALELFRDAERRAREAKLDELTLQAKMAVGSCLVMLGRIDEAASCYGEAGRFGVETGATVLAIEAFRMSGQLLASRNRLEEAATAFRGALGAAEETPSDQRALTSAPHAARELAALCRKHGLVQQAASLEAQAAALEELPDPPADPSSPPSSPTEP